MSIRAKRGTRAQVNAAAGANGLKEGELIYLTDEKVFAGATGVGEYQEITGGPRCIYRAIINANGTVASSSGVPLTAFKLGTGAYAFNHGLGTGVVGIITPSNGTVRATVSNSETGGGITTAAFYGYNNTTLTDTPFQIALFL